MTWQLDEPMADVFTAAKRSTIMQAIRRDGTAPERRLREMLDRIKLDYCVNVASLPGKPDIVIPAAHLVIFVHGCFWHGHKSCSKGTKVPASNPDFWIAKRLRNQRRDRLVSGRLRRLGYSVHAVWECQLRRGNLHSRLLRLLQDCRHITRRLCTVELPAPRSCVDRAIS
jgi:DNA mismatch endonuclease (patch repair protein)